MNGCRKDNLRELIIEREEKLKKKFGNRYRTPLQRWLEDMSAFKMMPEHNVKLGNLPFVKVAQ